jgi:precorrin-6B methylase 1
VQQFTATMPEDGRVSPKHVVEECTGVSERSQTVIVVNTLVKEDEREGQGHFHKPQVSHMTPHFEHALFLHEHFLD